jgi:hypothetical protein
LATISEAHFQAQYGFFVHVLNPENGHFKHETNLFFERERDFTVLSGIYQGVRLVPVPPLRVYKRIRSDRTDCIGDQRSWMVDVFLAPLLADRSSPVRFVAGEEAREVMVSPLLRQRLCPGGEVPLLVLTTASGSLAFAETVMDLLHCCSKKEMMDLVREKDLPRRLSVGRTRKMYDIFPEEFFHMPPHLWSFLRSIDQYELTPEDVEELSAYYKQQ